MSTEDLVRAWKDPDHRAGYAGVDHPAGGIELASGETGGAEEGTGTVCATVVLSCTPVCDNTMFEGTCGSLSIGCC